MGFEYTCLRNSNLFINLVDENIEEVGENLHSFTLQKGQLLFSASDQLKDIFIIRSGHIKIYSLQDGKESIVEVLSKGDTFGSFSKDTARKGLFAEAIDKASVCKLGQEQFLKIIATNPEVAVSIIEELTVRLDQAHQKMANITLGDSQEKVYSELLRLGKKIGKIDESGFYSISTKFSHQQIADMVGLSRESVSHAFTKLKKQGLVKVRTGRICVR